MDHEQNKQQRQSLPFGKDKKMKAFLKQNQVLQNEMR